MTAAPIERSWSPDRTFQPLDGINTYVHTTFTEQDSPELAREAWRVHAEGYVNEGFIVKSALQDGILPPEIDKARGPYVEYSLAVDPAEPRHKASMRELSAPEGDYRNLPAYQLSRDHLTLPGRNFLDALHRSGANIKEISALSRTEGASPLSVMEIIRKRVHEAKPNDVWLFSIVTSTFDALTKGFGTTNFNVIGEDVKLEDERVNPNIRLRPALWIIDRLVDNILTDYYTTADPRQKRSLKRNFLFMTEGLDRSRMSDAVWAGRQALLNSVTVPLARS